MPREKPTCTVVRLPRAQAALAANQVRGMCRGPTRLTDIGNVGKSVVISDNRPVICVSRRYLGALPRPRGHGLFAAALAESGE